MSSTDTASSLTQHVTKIEAGAYVTAAAFIGRVPVLALGDGQVIFAEIGAEKRINAHPDAGLLVAAPGKNGLITGGDDGRVVEIGVNGQLTEIFRAKGGWIDALAARDDGSIAWASGQDGACAQRQGRGEALHRTFDRTRHRLRS